MAGAGGVTGVAGVVGGVWLVWLVWLVGLVGPVAGVAGIRYGVSLLNRTETPYPSNRPITTMKLWPSI